MNWLTHAAAQGVITAGVLASGIALVKSTFKTWIERRISTASEIQLENIKASFRAQEEHLKAELRSTEEILKTGLSLRQAEISALRTMAKSGFDRRQEGFEKRRVEAIELLWTAANEMRVFNLVAAAMSTDAYPNLLAAYRGGPARKILDSLVSDDAMSAFGKNDARLSALYVSEYAWTLFNAYQRVIGAALLKYQALKNNVEMNFSQAGAEIDTLKAALPDLADSIDAGAQHGGGDFLTSLYTALTAELRRDLRGEDVDEENLRRAANVEAALGKWGQASDMPKSER